MLDSKDDVNAAANLIFSKPEDYAKDGIVSYQVEQLMSYGFGASLCYETLQKHKFEYPDAKKELVGEEESNKKIKAEEVFVEEESIKEMSELGLLFSFLLI